MTTVGIIPARGGSKGIPRKNVKLLAGKPLIAYAIETALACDVLDRVIVSSDDKEIAEIARAWGADVPFLRPPELALDTTPMFPVLRHALNWLERADGNIYDLVVILDPTSPFRTPEHIAAGIQAMKDDPQADVVTSVCEVEYNPYFVMAELRGEYLVPVVTPERPIYRRQDAPVVFRENACVCVVRRNLILERDGYFFGVDKVRPIIMSPEQSVHVDSPLDWAFAEFLLQQKMEARHRVGSVGKETT